MENGYVILGIIALLFLSMYGFSYYSVFKERAQQKKEQQLEAEAEAQRVIRRQKMQAEIDARVEKFNKRKEEIQHELELLKKIKEQQVG
ncbi:MULTISPECIES: hypothetical protein [Aestuariibaculum]|uniref:DUF3552 domain-containing protein n=1 Tax=Aestuariibaculum lutulentum TaxID=2920935 RepID=A0ABS9REM5_9FLAO|nr:MULTISPECIES: hypothetical protein [Aestuariibaculum]MCH4551394.1 hypothetical protein [Aestuariibaculum lutulentum]MCR8666489.1 hypothetical protein [Aestuariibaculum sp. M13]